MDVRKHVLKPLHRWLHAFAPDTADWVRSQWNQVSHEISVWRVLRKDKEEPRRATLLIDVSKICMRDAGTGIQRVVRAVVRELDAVGTPVLPCQVYHHALVTGHRFFQAIKGEAAASGEESFVQIQSGDDLLLLDASFEFARELGEAIDEVHVKGGKAYAVIYDLLPIQAPEDFSSSYDVRVFCNWITMILSKADVLLCISRTVADAVVRLYLRDEEVRRARAGRALVVDAFPMGFDITEHDGEAREAMRRFVEGAGVTLLMVGTVEVRKQHDVVLQALEQMPDLVQGGRVRLLILGHDGWKNERFKERLQADAQGIFAEHVLWVQDASDDEVQWAYRHCSALVAASHDEGFGLPLVEAAHFGLPIICSDIPIFHEVTEEHATFFREGDAADLARVIRMWIDEDVHPDSSLIPMHTWRESAEAILAILHGKVEPYRVVE